MSTKIFRRSLNRHSFHSSFKMPPDMISDYSRPSLRFALCYVPGHHSPYEAAQFAGHGSHGDIVRLVEFQGHMVELPPQTLIGLVGIGDDFRRIPILPRFQLLRFVSHLSSIVALRGLDEQSPQMGISCLGDSQPVLAIAAGMFPRNKPEESRVLLGLLEAVEIARLHEKGQCRMRADADHAREAVHFLGVALALASSAMRLSNRSTLSVSCEKVARYSSRTSRRRPSSFSSLSHFMCFCVQLFLPSENLKPWRVQNTRICCFTFFSAVLWASRMRTYSLMSESSFVGI